MSPMACFLREGERGLIPSAAPRGEPGSCGRCLREVLQPLQSYALRIKRQSISALPLMPLLGESGPGLDAHIASLSASIALVQFPLLALLDFRFCCSGF